MGGVVSPYHPGSDHDPGEGGYHDSSKHGIDVFGFQIVSQASSGLGRNSFFHSNLSQGHQNTPITQVCKGCVREGGIKPVYISKILPSLRRDIQYMYHSCFVLPFQFMDSSVIKVRHSFAIVLIGNLEP